MMGGILRLIGLILSFFEPPLSADTGQSSELHQCNILQMP